MHMDGVEDMQYPRLQGRRSVCKPTDGGTRVWGGQYGDCEGRRIAQSGGTLLCTGPLQLFSQPSLLRYVSSRASGL